MIGGQNMESGRFYADFTGADDQISYADVDTVVTFCSGPLRLCLSRGTSCASTGNAFDEVSTMTLHRVLTAFLSLLTLACLTDCAACGDPHQSACGTVPKDTGIPGGSDGGGGGGGGGM
jgi:hypothetical protein